MSLINCPECEKKVSDTARACPHCGYTLRKCCSSGPHHGRFIIVPIMFICLAAFVFLIIFCTATVNVNSNNGMINIHRNKRGIFPSLRFNCRCRCK
jgi:hypothetical protein